MKMDGQGETTALLNRVRQALSLAASTRDSTYAGLAELRELLPAVVDKLACLNALETKFQETLEAEKLEAMAELAAGAGHEINNPLAVIAGRAQLFLRSEEHPERRRELALVNSQAMRIYEMIADMMLFARPPEPRKSPCDLSELVDDLVAELAARAAERQTELARVGAREPIAIEADATQLMVALRAVCDNALEALGQGGHIETSAQAVNGGAQVVIRDDGPGISPEVRRHLFDPFYSGRAAGRGIGLGLSKCWRIVTNHGGRIEVDCGLGRGATFTITLPTRAAGPPDPDVGER
jgi:signal transduction histidine kinase